MNIKIITYNNLTRIKFNFNKSIALIADFKNWSDFESNLVKELIKKGNENNLEKVLILSVGELFFSGIYSKKNIANIVKDLEIDRVIFYIANPFIRQMSLDDLKMDFTNNLNIKKVMVAKDYVDQNTDKFNTNTLLEMYKEDCIVIELNNNNTKLTQLTDCLKKSDFDCFSKTTGLIYNFDGRVIQGKQLGRTIGFPTINIDVKKAIPLTHGVYGTKVIINHDNREFFGAGCYWENSLGQDIFEINIFDFNEEIYGQEVNIQPLFRVRDNIKINSIEELKETLQKDVDLIKSKV